jgi:D-aminoacyl-tRNA deacylase
LRALIQRVSRAKVEVEGRITGQIGCGFLILLGIAEDDEMPDLQWLTNKIVGLRVFSDAEGKMNLSIRDVGGELLVVSQFTLHAQYKKGNRPSFIRAAHPEKAIPLYEAFIATLEAETGQRPATGEFGAMMQVELTNDGPVTIMLDSKNPE